MIKITIEENGKTKVIESEYMILIGGNKESDKLFSGIDVRNLTYEEATRCNAWLGWLLIENLNKFNKETKVKDEDTK